MQRYSLLCQKLMQEQFHTAAAAILFPRIAAKTGEYSEVTPLTGLKSFVTTLAGHIAAEAAL